MSDEDRDVKLKKMHEELEQIFSKHNASITDILKTCLYMYLSIGSTIGLNKIELTQTLGAAYDRIIRLDK